MRPAAGRGLLSSVALGTSFEFATQQFLAAAPFFLHRVIRTGRSADHGVDLRAYWDLDYSSVCAAATAARVPFPRWPPPRSSTFPPAHTRTTAEIEAARAHRSRTRFPVIVQCKRWTARVGPDVVRELEGTTQAQGALRSLAPFNKHKPRTRHFLAILVSLSGFTPGALARAASSKTPMMLLHLPLKKTPPPSHAEDADECEEEYELKRIEINKPMMKLVGEEAFKRVEKVGLSGKKGRKVEVNWLEG